MRIWIRTLWGEIEPASWQTAEGRHQLQKYLNEQGFYVLTGFGDALEVYAISEDTPPDVATYRRIIATIERTWSTIKKEVI